MSEIRDASGLTYLRARYLDSSTGRFTQRDPSGLEANVYLYAEGNPGNLTDPRGLISGLSGPGSFINCIRIHTIMKGNVSIPAIEAVRICKSGFDPSSWSLMPHGNISGTPTSAHNLFLQYINESGTKNWLHFSGNESLTQELARGTLINNVRQWYYSSGGDLKNHTNPQYRGGDTSEPIHYNFGLADYIASGLFDIRFSFYKLSLPLEFVLGSFRFQVKTIKDNDGSKRVGFRIDNDMTVESGTHILGRLRGDYSGSVEGLIANRPDLAYKPLSEVINEYTSTGQRPISILSSRSRFDQSDTNGGGSLFQTFTWTEQYDPCMFIGNIPHELVPHLLDVGVWDNWRGSTVWPGNPFPRTGP